MSTDPISPDHLTQPIHRAITALQKWRHAKSQTQNPKLLPSDEFFYLMLTLKNIPPKSRTNAYKLPLPHPILSLSLSSSICLIIDDRHDRITSKSAKEKISVEGIPVSKVIRLRKLKTDYKAFEAKRRLCDSYDMFFADKRVIPLLPKMIGKSFYKKKKVPVPVDLEKKDWKGEIERVLRSALLYLGTGTCSVVKIGNVEMGEEEVVENVVAAVKGAVEKVPGKWGNVRSVHLKLAESLALPVYQAVPEMDLTVGGMIKTVAVGDGIEEDGVDKKKRKRERGESKKVDEDLDKKSKRVSKKGRIHEIQYMDNGAGDLVGAEFVQEISDPVENKKNESDGDSVQEKALKVIDKLSNGKIKKSLKKGRVNETRDMDSDANGFKMNTEVEDDKIKNKVDEDLDKKRQRVSKKGRIHEIQYMDNGAGDLVGAEFVQEISDPVESKKNESDGDLVQEKALKVIDKLSNGKIKKALKKGRMNETRDMDSDANGFEMNTEVEDDKIKNKDVDDSENVVRKRKKSKESEKRSTKAKKEKMKAQ